MYGAGTYGAKTYGSDYISLTPADGAVGSDTAVLSLGDSDAATGTDYVVVVGPVAPVALESATGSDIAFVVSDLVYSDGATGKDAVVIAISTPSIVQEIITVASQQLQDITNAKWQINPLISYLNQALREIVTLKPEAYTQTIVITLAAGAQQALPSDVITLIDVTFNMGPISAPARGNAVLPMSRNKLDFLLPGWANYPPSVDGSVAFSVQDDRNPYAFFVFPPASSTIPSQVELLVSKMPAHLTLETDTFPFDASYIVACIDYVIYRALVEETTIPNAQAKGQSFYKKFVQDIGLKTNVERQISREQGTDNDVIPKGQRGQGQ